MVTLCSCFPVSGAVAPGRLADCDRAAKGQNRRRPNRTSARRDSGVKGLRIDAKIFIPFQHLRKIFCGQPKRWVRKMALALPVNCFVRTGVSTCRTHGNGLVKLAGGVNEAPGITTGVTPVSRQDMAAGK